MKENNELIARFMNKSFASGHITDFRDGHVPTALLNALKYHSSWDWLMPVVEKIEKLHSSNFEYDMNQIASGIWPKDNEYMDVIALPLATPISEAYEAVVKFIQWYNTKQLPGRQSNEHPDVKKGAS